MLLSAYLQKGFKFRVGEGDVSFWFDQWLGNELICNMVPYVDIHDLHMRVKDIYYEGCWHFEELHTSLPADIQHQIMSVFVHDTSRDLIIWGHSTNGSYSASDAYKWLNEQEDTQAI